MADMPGEGHVGSRENESLEQAGMGSHGFSSTQKNHERLHLENFRAPILLRGSVYGCFLTKYRKLMEFDSN